MNEKINIPPSFSIPPATAGKEVNAILRFKLGKAETEEDANRLMRYLDRDLEGAMENYPSLSRGYVVVEDTDESEDNYTYYCEVFCPDGDDSPRDAVAKSPGLVGKGRTAHCRSPARGFINSQLP